MYLVNSYPKRTENFVYLQEDDNAIEMKTTTTTGVNGLTIKRLFPSRAVSPAPSVSNKANEPYDNQGMKISD